MDRPIYVVVRIPGAGDPQGNLAVPMVPIYQISDPSGMNVTEFTGMGLLTLRLPVFRLGEVLMLDANDRDQFGRKPSKWDVGLEGFDAPDAAFARAFAVVEADDLARLEALSR